jgi:hypothetical protein
LIASDYFFNEKSALKPCIYWLFGTFCVIIII